MVKVVSSIVVTALLSISLCTSSLAERAQQNKVDNSLFDQIPNRQQLEADLRATTSFIQDGMDAKKDSSNADDKSEASKQGKIIRETILAPAQNSAQAKQLENLDPHEVESKGMVTDGYKMMNSGDFFPDKTAPGMTAYQKQAEEIGSSTASLIRNLTNQLKDFGLDCKEVNTAGEIDPAWQVEIAQQVVPDSYFKQVFCEKPRNRYTCSNSLTTRCTKKGKKWGEWQHGQDYYYTYRSNLKSTGERPFFKSFKKHEGNLQSMIAQDTGRVVDAIHPDVRSDHRIYYDFGYDIDKFTITVNYKYRDKIDTCEQWTDDWDESCNFVQEKK